MTRLLLGKPVVKALVEKLSQNVKEQELAAKYIAIILIGENKSSEVYIRMKQKFGEKIGIGTKVYRDSDIFKWNNKKSDIVSFIEVLNKDDDCIGIIIQLPLPKYLREYTDDMYAHVSPLKDVDGLGGKIQIIAEDSGLDFMPATASAVMTLLDFYDHKQFEWKKIAVLGQSNLVGKPLSLHLMRQWAVVFSFNEESNQEEMREICTGCDYIISCTWQIHLIDQEFIGKSNNQVIVDVGYGHLDGKAVGDVDFAKIVDKVWTITPVPWWVGPLTVAELFSNAIKLYIHSREQ